MKILVLADHESKSLYEFYDPQKLKDVELILACGDLRRNYLEFFASVSHAPLLYVLGNHDGWYHPDIEGGSICIEDQIYEYQGIRILGLGGSMEYVPGAENQYTERQMDRRIKRLRWKLKRKKGFDILVAHAPAGGINDLEDLPHKGFDCFRELLDTYRPKYFLHGHVHASYGNTFKRVDKYGDTIIINGYDNYIIEYPDV